MIRILIADQHPVVREGLKRIAERQPDMEIVGEAGDMRRALDEGRRKEPDVIVLDVAMPGPGFRETLRRLRAECPEARILVVSVHTEDNYAVPAFRAGAAGYLTKDRSPEELAEAIRKVHEGHKYVTPTVAERLARDLEADAERPLHESLSDREYQIFCMLGAGKSISQIASEVKLSPKTVSTYRTRTLAKMHLENNAEIMRYVIEHKLL